MTLDYMVEERQNGLRIDVYITQMLVNDEDIRKTVGTFSRSYLQKLIKDGCVLINDKPSKSNVKVRIGDNVRVIFPQAIEPDIVPENIPMSILYEDKDVIIIDKPKGMVVHPAAGHYSGTLVNALLYHCKDELSGINGVMRPGIVHRIDMDTTGALLVCKNDTAHQFISKQLKEHSITRRYRAIVHGVIQEEAVTIAGTIGRHPKDRKRMAMHVQNGKEAITHVKVLQRFQNYTYIECSLETGRTHQIRVHMAGIHHPLLGDAVYGRGKERYQLQGQTLHAMVLGFLHPHTKEYMEFEAPLPEYFEHLLRILV